MITKKFEKVINSLSSIFIYIKKLYGLWLCMLIMLFNFEH